MSYIRPESGFVNTIRSLWHLMKRIYSKTGHKPNKPRPRFPGKVCCSHASQWKTIRAQLRCWLREHVRGQCLRLSLFFEARRHTEDVANYNCSSTFATEASKSCRLWDAVDFIPCTQPEYGKHRAMWASIQFTFMLGAIQRLLAERSQSVRELALCALEFGASRGVNMA